MKAGEQTADDNHLLAFTTTTYHDFPALTHHNSFQSLCTLTSDIKRKGGNNTQNQAEPNRAEQSDDKLFNLKLR